MGGWLLSSLFITFLTIDSVLFARVNMETYLKGDLYRTCFQPFSTEFSALYGVVEMRVLAVMAKNYVVRSRGGVLEIRFLEVAKVGDLYNVFNEISETPIEKMRLWDFSAGLDLSSTDVRELAEYVKSKEFQPIRVTVVAPSDMSFGLARMATGYREDYRTDQRVFRSLNDAREWVTNTHSE